MTYEPMEYLDTLMGSSPPRAGSKANFNGRGTAKITPMVVIDKLGRIRRDGGADTPSRDFSYGGGKDRITVRGNRPRGMLCSFVLKFRCCRPPPE